ncbi:MAG: hypothetical protein GY803_03320 [Chloroflexi bacterium]|nr:hypothetical protein [Chloroflexota bacterium]
MKNKVLIILASFILAACATPTGTYTAVQDVPGANATHQTAQQQAQLAAQRATGQAGEATAAAGSVATGTAAVATRIWQATADNLAVQMTQNAINSKATQEVISAEATGTAVAQVAQAEQRLIEDEQTRLALQRQKERNALEYQRIMNEIIKPLLWVGLVLAVLMVAGSFAYRLYQRSHPLIVPDMTGPRVLIPANSYQVLPSPRSPLALPKPSRETAVSPVTLPH